MHESMDISPLPHKAPFVAQIDISSPTPIQPPEEDMMVDDSPVPPPRQQSLEPPKSILAE